MNSFQHIAQTLTETEPSLRLALVFGSYAAGNEQFESDIDLAVLGDRALSDETVMRLGKAINDQHGRPGHIVDLYEVPLPISAVALNGTRLFGTDAYFNQIYLRYLLEQEGFGKARERVIEQSIDQWTR